MTDTTNVDDVVVIGQRKRPDGTFPPAGGGGSGTGSGVHQNEVSPDDPNPPTQPHPCHHPDTALDWNADAAAAEALRRMIATALAQHDITHNLSNREYGAMICQQSDGSLTVSGIQWGDPIFDANGYWLNPGQQPTVDVNFFACGAGARPLAMMHTHPSTGPGGCHSIKT